MTSVRSRGARLGRLPKLDATQLDEASGTHGLRRTDGALVHHCTGALRACRLLLGHTKLESTVRHLGIGVDEALVSCEQADL